MRVSVAVTAQTDGSGLSSILRIFDVAGAPIAENDQEGGDPHLTFQAAAASDYFIGVSSAGNDRYDSTHPVRCHPRLGPPEIAREYREAWRTFYTWRRLARCLAAKGRS